MNTPQYSHPKGVTLIELTVVIAMILTLTSSLFFSANYYKDSSNKANCIVQLQGIQKVMRSYQNFNSLSPGDPIAKSDIVGAGKAIPEEVFCPHSGGSYILATEIPSFGTAFATCEDFDSTVGSDPSQEHNAQDTTGW